MTEGTQKTATKRHAGLVPRACTAVKPYTLIASESDTAQAVAQRMTGDPDRYAELVAANSHKPRTSAPEGFAHQSFAGLAAGEPLLVPASWPDPADLPTELGLGAGSAIDQLGPFVSTFQGMAQYLDNAPGGKLLPKGANAKDVATVVYAWWPYVQQQAGTMIGGQPWPDASNLAQAFLNPTESVYLSKLAASAASFLSNTGAPADVALQIPWDQVPWDKVPWGQIKYLSGGSQKKEFWDLLQSSQRAHTVPIGVSAGVGLCAGAPTDFANVDWSADEYQNVSWTEVPWTDIAWDNAFGDGKLSQCYSKNPGRWAAMGKCKECFDNKGIDFLKKYLCDVSLDPCFCKSIVTPGKIDTPIKKDPGTGTATVPNYSCTPFPDCLSQPGNWPAGMPHPCEPFPGCVPEWAKNQPGGTGSKDTGTGTGTGTGGKTGGTGTGTGTTGTGAPPAPKTDNTMLWVLGGTAAVAFTVAVVAVAATRG